MISDAYVAGFANNELDDRRMTAALTAANAERNPWRAIADQRSSTNALPLYDACASSLPRALSRLHAQGAVEIQLSSTCTLSYERHTNEG